MDLRVTEESGFAVIAPVGRLNIESADDFRRTYQQLLDAGQIRFVVDLGAADYVDSAGLGALIGLVKRVNGRSGQVRVCSVPPLIQDIFQLTRLNLVLDIRPNRAEALAAR